MRITVKVHPRAKRNRLTGGPENYKLEVTAPPVDGAANDAVVGFFAKGLRVRRSEIQIVTGEHGRTKVIELPITEERALQVLL